MRRCVVATVLLSACAESDGRADGLEPPFGRYEFPPCEFVEPEVRVPVPRPSAECERLPGVAAPITPLERALTPRAHPDLERVALAAGDRLVAEERDYQRVVCEVDRIRAL